MKEETTRLQCENASLYCELRVPDTIPAPALLICHGMNVQGFHALRVYNQLAEEACKRGFIVVLFDFRGVGKSTGRFEYGIGEQQDVRCLLDYVASRPEVLSDSIFIVGHSLGGAVSLYALEDEKRVRGLVLWAVPKNHDYNVRKFIARTKGRRGLWSFLVLVGVDRIFDVSRFYKFEVYGIDLRPKDVREKLMTLDECRAISKLHDMPVLIVIGDSDKIVGEDEAREVFNSANEPKSLLKIESADHTFRGKESELVAATVEWIEKLK